MFKNLQNEIQKKMGIPAFAKLMGFTEKTARNKLNEQSEFTWKEVQKVCAIWPEYNMKWLFASVDHTEENMSA